MASDHVFNTSDANFERDVLNAKGLHLVDFWAEWCGPCKLLGPTLESVAKDRVGDVKVFKMNVDDNPATPARYHVRGIPTVIVVKDGQVVDQIVGNHPKEDYLAAIDKHS